MRKNFFYFIIAGLVILNVFTLNKLNNLENNMNSRFQQREFADNNMRQKIENIYANVDTMLKKQTSILDSQNLSFGSLNSQDFTVPVILAITPKEYSNKLTANLQINDNTIEMQKDGKTSFTITTKASIFDNLKLKVILNENGVKKTETINEYYNLHEKYLLQISGGFSGKSFYRSNQYQYDGELRLKFHGSQEYEPVKVSIIEDINGNVVHEKSADGNSNIIPVNSKVDLSAGDKLTIYAYVQDKYGLNYKYSVLAYEVDSKREPVDKFPDYSLHNIIEITDRNGQVVYAPEYKFEKVN